MSTFVDRWTDAQVLLADAERVINLIRGSLLICRQDGGFEHSMLQVGRLVELENSAAETSLLPVALTLSSLAAESARIIAAGEGLPDDDALLLLDQIAHVEAEILKARPIESVDDVDISDFVDQTFNGLWGPELDDEAERSLSSDTSMEPADEFEPDDEMLAIFRIEADELLSNIDSGVESLSQAPSDKDALWNVRRNAHTLKGAAGIIGLRDLSQVAHKVEDILDLFSDSEIEPDFPALRTIASASAIMRELSEGSFSGAQHARMLNVCSELDSLLDRYKAGPSDGGDTLLAIPELSANEVQPESPEPQLVQAAHRPIVRVAISRLDELTDSVRDLLLSRTVLSKRMDELEKMAGVMSRTAIGVRSAAQRIENEFEAAMLDDVRPAITNEVGPQAGGGDDESEGETRFDSLEMDRYTAFHLRARELTESAQECFSQTAAFEALTSSISEAFDIHRRLVDQVQQRAMQIRLIRFGSIATRLERAVRVTAQEHSKLAEIVVADQEIEIDTDVLDSLVEPLMHLVKNAVAHGIENSDTRRLVGKRPTGIITVRARNDGTHIVVTVNDDGRGISGKALAERAAHAGLAPSGANGSEDPKSLIDLIFVPGLTTADKLTISAGRGVGLSIVKQSVEEQGGAVSVETEIHAGTTFTLKVPLGFSVAHSVLVSSAGNTAAITARSVLGLHEIERNSIDDADNGPTATIAGEVVPFRTLRSYFRGENGVNVQVDPVKVLLIDGDEERIALEIDEFLRSEEIIIKALPGPLDNIPGVMGAALLGTGEAVPVLDIGSLCEPDRQSPESHRARETKRVPRVLVVDDSPSVRHMTANALKAAGFEPVTAKDGAEALDLIREGPPPDVILSDVEMPRMDGFTFAKTLKAEQQYRNIPFLFISSRVSEKHRQRAAELGITGHLAKPFSNSDLIEVIKNVRA